MEKQMNSRIDTEIRKLITTIAMEHSQSLVRAVVFATLAEARKDVFADPVTGKVEINLNAVVRETLQNPNLVWEIERAVKRALEEAKEIAKCEAGQRWSNGKAEER